MTKPPSRILMLRPGDVHLYTVCEHVTAGLIYFMVIFTPWAFGTTQSWSIWTMNAFGYILGALLAIKLLIRWGKGYSPPRWEISSVVEPEKRHRKPLLSLAFLKWTLVLLNGAILLFCVISAWNASATHD